MWRFGAIDFKFKPIQKRLQAAFNAVTTFLFVCLVARQTGKSFFWFCICIETALKKPNARIRYGTAFHEDLTEFIIPVAQTILDDCPDDIKPKYHKVGSKFVFKNGSEIKLIGLDINPDGIRGNALDLVVIDEAGFVSKLGYVFSIIISMLRHRPNLRVVMSSSAPETPDHEFKEFYQRALLEGAAFMATIDHDETCTQETKDRIAKEGGGKDSTTYRRECLCEFVVDSELAIIPEWEDSYVEEIAHDEFFPYYHKYNAQDLGVVDYTANIYAYYDWKRATLVIEDESMMRGPTMTTDKHADMLKNKEHELWGDKESILGWNRKLVHRRISDNDNPLLLNDLGCLHGIHFVATSKDELPAMVNEARLLVKQGRVRVHPRCKMLIGCLKYGIYNSAKIKREFARSKAYGHYDHLAAFIYLVRNLDVHSCPIPKTLGLSHYTHHIHPENLRSKNEEAVREIMGQAFLPKRIN